MSESDTDLVKFLKESLLVSLNNMNNKVDTMSATFNKKVDDLSSSLNEKVSSLTEKIEITQVSVSTLSNKVTAFDVEKAHIKTRITDMCGYLGNDKVRLDDIEYKKLPAMKSSIETITLVKGSYWKAMAAILAICVGLTGIIGFMQGVFKRDGSLTKEDLKALVRELKTEKSVDTIRGY